MLIAPLVGHAAAVAAFRAAMAGGRPHHGWLLAGPPGIGKAHFATLAASWLLAGMPPGEGFAGAADSQAARLVAAGSHPDLRRLVRTEDERGRLRSLIRVDEVRALQPFIAQTPSLANWRLIIVDSADELNPNAANALLKSLEEPHPNTLFLLISHAPGRLLPTIRSRCRLLRFQPLSQAEVASLLARETRLEQEDIAALARLSAGSAGAALAMAEPGIARLAADLAALARTPADQAGPAALALARQLSGKDASGRFAAFLAQVPDLLAAAARTAHGAARARLIEDWSAARELASAAGPLGLDPQTVAFDLARRLAGAAT